MPVWREHPLYDNIAEIEIWLRKVLIAQQHKFYGRVVFDDPLQGINGKIPYPIQLLVA